MSEVVGEVGWLVCPLVLVWRRVKEVDVRVDEQENSTVVTIALYEAFNWVEVFCSCLVSMVCQGAFDWVEVFSFVR